ncbi:MAG: response regulator [Anaerolineales bacterium]|nr:response regulator [Anaerolineales bacterium]NUQ83879.1 response regulator [Anaerolineales bacterium]
MTKIMVVDDDKDATALFEEVLRAEGYDPILLNESAKAIQIAKQEKPSLFILDLMMPEPDGFKLCRMLRREPEFRNTPIIIVTALNDTDSRIVAIGAGANDYLTKPFRLDELYASIKDHLDDLEL